ncbi:hypothetical protein BU24DRAFT_450227 [Aaosphaeria arxii CBS 175.79]|uniref:Inactive metallocarboxypeptidase ECM14 n=1 Tax=Aaosphaeria arxii CBS 175.79 TaxID=1450172 RepID=A0A6A5XQT8_9PLEO|nr:uncharacterized protein BU24DRAFT_450227 [Aaosphaeria arxii CBS 175.79]KAF2015532.1 hypothetical protein BU24DRAFT_450227 [Aaosphaeria arxii CBS 175.79]
MHSRTLLSLLLLTPSTLHAAPHHPTSELAHDLPLQPLKESPRPWRKLSDAVIRKIWGESHTQANLRPSSGNSQEQDDTLGKQTIAQYGDDMVLRFTISTPEEAQSLADAADILFLDIWEFNEDWVDVRIAQDVLPSLLNLLPDSLQKSHVPLMQNLELAQAIFDSYPSASAQSHDNDRAFSSHLKTTSPSRSKGHPFFQDYQPLSVISPWMSLMSSMFTTHVRKINVGITYEGRDIPALRVGVHPTNNDEPTPPRRTVLITGGSHAREWISTSTVNYIAWSLINSYGKIYTVTKLLENFDFVFVPTLNPDGYAYTWETDRLWRKNRQPTSLRFCHGIDLDRSYPFEWDGNTSRSNPCSESYAGDEPFHGVESQRFAEWAKNETDNSNVEFVAFLDLHSYSQQILYPYSYTCNIEPPTIEDLEELALGLAKAIRVSKKGHQYKVTSACEGNVAITTKDSKGKKDRVIFPRIESSGGSALDWFYHELRVKYAYQVKLRDTGSYGFLLPKDNIIPTGEEMLDAILYFGRFMLGEVGFAAEAETDPEGLLKPMDTTEDVDVPEGEENLEL